MASTFSTALRLELMGTGDQTGTWGVTNNTNLGTLLEQSITGVLSVAQGDTTLTLSANNGASDQSRNAVLNFTGAMTAGRNVVVPTSNKLYLVKNSTTGGFAVTVKTAAGTGVAIVASSSQWVYCDGTNVVQGLSGTLATQAASAVAITGGTITNTTLATPTITGGTSSGATISSATITGSTLTSSTIAGYLLLAGGTMTGALGITGSTTNFRSILAQTTDPGALGPTIDLFHNSASPAASDQIGSLGFIGNNSVAANIYYAQIAANIIDPVSTTEDSNLSLFTRVAGTLISRLTVAQGLAMTGATSGDMGVGTVNATALYVNGGLAATLAGANQVVTGGARITSNSLGTISSGTVTLDPGTRPMQHYTNNGAHTLAPGSNGGSIILDIVNGASAGAITTSGWTKVVGAFTTTNTNAFRCSCTIGNNGSLLSIQALQ